MTLLGVGVMSKNCVDAALRWSERCHGPIMLIASRRQVDAGVLGGGYANSWSTEELARYVRDRAPQHRVILARDHGGPWQGGSRDIALPSLDEAMKAAKASYEADIESGFEVIHIDPSLDPRLPASASLSPDQVLERVFELYAHCYQVARRCRREIVVEVGTEEQSGGVNSVEELRYVLQRIRRFCRQEGLPAPLFVVVQTGTRVVGRANAGSLDDCLRRRDGRQLAQLHRIISTCEREGVFLKEHNADYLSDSCLNLHPGLRIHAANVAPEFAVAENAAWLHLLKLQGWDDLLEATLALTESADKWKKWTAPGASPDRHEKALVSAHYHYGRPEFRQLKAEAERRNLGRPVDTFLRGAVVRAMTRYLKAFNLLAPTLSSFEQTQPNEEAAA